MDRDARRDRLAALIQYFVRSDRVDKQATIAREIGIETDTFNNFVACGTHAHMQEIENHVRRMVDTDKEFVAAPAYVRLIAHELFDAAASGATPEAIIDAVANRTHDSVTFATEAYRGTWHVIRYAAHSEPRLQPVQRSDNVFESYVVRAAMHVTEGDSSSGLLPTFRIRYRPHLNPTMCRNVVGSIIPLKHDNHWFLGWSPDTQDMMDIVVRETGKNAERFVGFARRRLESGQFMVSLVAFVRDKQQRTLDELEDSVRIDLESDFIRKSAGDIPDAAEVLGLVRNLVKNEGKSGLVF